MKHLSLIALLLGVLVSNEGRAEPSFTGISGTVLDATTGEAVIDAAVKATDGTRTVSARADVDGAFRLRLAPGSWDVRVYFEFYKSRRMQVSLGAGETRTLDVQLEPDSGEVQEVVVEAKADTRTEAAVLAERKRSTTVRDAISAQEIARTPDSSASDAVKRVVSATVVDGRYVVLRGLGGRYSTTLLNGVAVPSPEPDEPSVPLDLFPTALLANLTVVKTHAPELPGHFSGGALLIETSSYPTKREWKLKLGLGGDSVTTFRARLDGPGGGLDWLGVDDGGRALPDAVPRDVALRAPEAGGKGLTKTERERIGESFSQNWTLRNATGLPNASVGASLGDTVALGGGKLGYLASIGYNRKESVRSSVLRKLRTGDELAVREELGQRQGGEQAGIGALANVGWQPSERHELGLFALYTRSGEGQATQLDGYSESDASRISSSRISWVERALAFGQLRGEHKLGGTRDLRLTWQANGSTTARDEPDTRDLRQLVRADGRRQFVNGTGSGERFWSELSDLAGGASGQVSATFGTIATRAGASVQGSTRSFDARRIRFDLQENSADPSILFLPPAEMFSDANIGPGFLPIERTVATDSYDASLLVGAGYVGAEAKPVEPLRLSAGARFEAARQTLTAGSPLAPARLTGQAVDRLDLDLLPSAGVVWAVGARTNLRAAYGYTLSRPQFRELAPFFYFDFNRARGTSGNPDLVTTRIHNADVRWEFFPADGEVVAAGGFYKQFANPIERIVVNTAQGDASFANAEQARALGLELEGRVSLGRITSALSDLKAQANVSLITSEVRLSAAQQLAQTNARRPLQGQSPYVVNAGLSWSRTAWGLEASLLYNVAGARLDEVGIQGIPDAYEQPIHRLDLSVAKTLGSGFRLKLSAANLLAQDVVLRQGALEVQRWSPGVSGGLGLEWSPSPN